MRTRHAGFTLIELLFVVALIGIMVAIAVPSFASFLSSYRVTSAVNDMLESISLARSEALKSGTRVVVAPISSDWRNGWTIYPMAKDGTIGATIFKHDVLPTSISITPAGSATSPFGGFNYVAFDGTGYPRTTAYATLSGGIVLTDKTGSATNIRTLCLTLFGRPRIVKLTDACTAV